VQAILNVAAPIFGVILLGYLAGRLRLLGGEASTALNAFVSLFALPLLFFGTLARTPVRAVLNPPLLGAFVLIVLVTFGVGMLSTLIARRRPARGESESAARPGLAAMSLQGVASSWGNVAYMGVPLCLSAFGDAGLAPAMLAVIVPSVLVMVLGVLLVELEIAAGHGPFETFLRAGLRVLRNPLPLSIIAGLLVSAFAVDLPVPLGKWVDLLAAAAAPCALFAIGLFLCDRGLTRHGLAEAGLATLIKLALQPLLAAIVLPWFVDPQSVGAKVVLLMAALPCGANAFVLAKQFDISVEQNSAAVLLSTVLSVLTVSALLVWLSVT
jgi:predicted permease